MTQTRQMMLIAAIVTALTGAAYAHSGATGIVKKRMDAMSDIGKSMKALGAFIKGEKAYNSATVKAAAQTIGTHAKMIPHLFPEGSNKKPSEALPAIWSDWTGFTAIAMEMETAAGALATAADSATDAAGIRPAFGSLGKTCKGCHQKFRLAK